MEKSLNWRETIITRLIRVSGYSAIVFVAAIFYFLLREGLPALAEVKFSDLFAVRWYPIENYFGILPLLTGSLIITVGALLIAFPFGIATAVFISEIAPRWAREILKPLVELLAGLPSVVLGFLGILVLAPYLRRLLDLPTGLTALAGSILLGGIAVPTIVTGLPSVVLGFLGILVLAPYLRRLLDLPTGLTALAGSILLGGIAVPTIVSIAEDALDSVPRSYREGAWALGATRWQTIWRVTLPAARSDDLARDPARRALWCADRGHARHRTRHRRDDDRDDGDGQRARAGDQTRQSLLPRPHDDRHDRGGNG